jgi:hypothetical protein
MSIAFPLSRDIQRENRIGLIPIARNMAVDTATSLTMWGGTVAAARAFNFFLPYRTTWITAASFGAVNSGVDSLVEVFAPSKTFESLNENAKIVLKHLFSSSMAYFLLRASGSAVSIPQAIVLSTGSFVLQYGAACLLKK